MENCYELNSIKRQIKNKLDLLKSRSKKTGEIINKSFQGDLSRTDKLFIEKNKKINSDIDKLRKKGMKIANKCLK